MKRAIFFTVVIVLAVAFSAIAFTPALAANPTPVQIYYVPLPEAQVRTFITTIGALSAASSTTDSTISIVTSDNSTIIYYDQWEDGYEATLSEPVQATTQIWGDGIAGNGCPPTKNGAVLTCNNANDVLNAGDVVVLRNNVPLPRVPANQLYDGRDKFGSTKALAVTARPMGHCCHHETGGRGGCLRHQRVRHLLHDARGGESHYRPRGVRLCAPVRHGRTGQH